MNEENYLFKIGDRVEKSTGDYVYEGNVVARFKKFTSRLTRYVVQDDRGFLFIFSEGQLKLK